MKCFSLDSPLGGATSCVLSWSGIRGRFVHWFLEVYVVFGRRVLGSVPAVVVKVPSS